MAMIRARVCLISDSGHLHLTRASGRKVTDVADQETAYQDIVGELSIVKARGGASSKHPQNPKRGFGEEPVRFASGGTGP